MSRPRPLGRVDLAILLAAAVAGPMLAIRVDRAASATYDPAWIEAVIGLAPGHWAIAAGLGLRLDADFKAALIAATLGLGLVVLRRPLVLPGKRWPGRGRAAIAVAAVGLMFELASLALGMPAEPRSTTPAPANPQALLFALQSFEGMARLSILGAWSLLALAGRWRSGPGPLERVGRLLGWSWLATLVVEMLKQALW